MTKHEEAILASCKRYISDEVQNKYVCEYYKRLTDIDLASTDKADLRDKSTINKNRLRWSVFYLSIGAVVIFLILLNLPKYIRYCIALAGFCLCSIIVLQVIGMYNRVIAKLMWSSYNCGEEEEWFVDLLVGRGIVKL